jgi:diguanylate cyclase (GGDEF)-like protein
MLSECNAKDVRRLIEQIRKQIGALSLTLHDTSLPAVTISAGATQMDGQRTSSDTLIAAADQALYAAKRQGRDRIETFVPRAPEPKPLEQA